MLGIIIRYHWTSQEAEQAYNETVQSLIDLKIQIQKDFCKNKRFSQMTACDHLQLKKVLSEVEKPYLEHLLRLEMFRIPVYRTQRQE